MAVQRDVLEGSATRGAVRTVTETEEVTNWCSREIEECISDADELRGNLLKSISMRVDKCLHPALEQLSKCLDLTDIVIRMEGKREGGEVMLDEVALAEYGEAEFREFVTYLASLEAYPDVNFNVVLSTRIHD